MDLEFVAVLGNHRPRGATDDEPGALVLKPCPRQKRPSPQGCYGLQVTSCPRVGPFVRDTRGPVGTRLKLNDCALEANGRVGENTTLNQQ
jgi:hypothetical protein